MIDKFQKGRMNVRENVKNEIINKLEKELRDINIKIDRNTDQINRLSEEQNILKKLKQDVARLINSVKGY